ncbi:MAG: hypothetical protein AUJ85_04260 [Elusimicrobia bacterium CG1_02_37_114]|nr:MAG: hypothetical protein AUJ85_04260 [Elusimicrobia bacterium CG1_02_37_114]PIV52779.1 MAG: hypothetical protein COS17_07300 [Elusimicrobia bacterium CG02_land_8_20_14_3_00_37_13]
MKTKDIMTQSVTTITRETTLNKILDIFKNFHTFPIVPVIDENKKLIGVISLKNIVEIFEPTKSTLIKSAPFIDQKEVDLFELEITDEMKHLCIAEDMMESKFVTLNEEMDLKEAYNLMRLHNLEEILVVNKENILVGRVGVFDIVRTVFVTKK